MGFFKTHHLTLDISEMKNRKIAFVIGNRAHYARVKPILKFLEADYRIILFESAVLLEFGNVKDQIVQDVGAEKLTELFTNISGGNLLSMTRSTGVAIMELSADFARNRPDAVVVIADRYEALAAAIAARYMNIPVVHIQGGENSGSIDDSIRHSITKLANIHLVTNQECADRVEQMGESKDAIYITGCPTIDICANLSSKDLQSLFQGHESAHEPKFSLRRQYLIVAFHPVTTEYELNKKHFDVLLESINDLDMQTIWLYPNIDAGNDLLRREIITFKAHDKRGLIHFFKHFPPEDYLLLVKNASCIIGNSSVGIRESSFLGTPSVSIGTRQQMRMHADNVVTSEIEKAVLKRNILAQVQHGAYPVSGLYGDGKAGERIAHVLMNCRFSIEKQMTY